MRLLPAIDLISGRCVRLQQGDFALETAYVNRPDVALQAFADGGAEEAHLVDLDGAKAREPRQHELFLELVRASPLRLQVAGGFRSRDHVARMLDAGIERVVIGSLALDEPEEFATLLTEFGSDRLTLALDVRLEGHQPLVARHGWLSESGRTLAEVMRQFPRVRHLLVTDIVRDGMLEGPNVALMRALATTFPAVALQASGGVASLDDLMQLRDTGAARAIVGKAIWEDRFTVEQAVRHARG
jgi:phosphoribosylformimino-5-aminoimidazole carboxamide ribotide isomerase